MTHTLTARLLLVGLLFLGPGAPVTAQEPDPSSAPEADEFTKTLDAAAAKGRDFLLGLYGQDPRRGGWGPDLPMHGMNALALNGLLRGRAPVQVTDERIAKVLTGLLNAQERDGAWVSPRRGQAVYETAVVLRAIVAAAQLDEAFGAREDVRAAMRRGRDYLLLSQIDEKPEVDAEGNAIEKPVAGPDAAEGGSSYGGWGYGRGAGGPANMGTSAMAMDAIDATSKVIGETDAVTESRKKLQNFLRHCHNLNEYQGKPYNAEPMETGDGGKVMPGNDGGAMYAPGASHAGTTDLQGGMKALKSYGSVTYALLQLYHMSGVVDRNDLRIVKAMEWCTRSENFVFTRHPGLPQDDAKSEYSGHYYFLYTAAHTLRLMVDGNTLEDSRGEEHNWREAIGRALLSLQQESGGWMNTNNGAHWENMPVIATSYTLIALGYLG